MGQTLKWWTGRSITEGPRMLEGSYIMLETLQEEGGRKSVKKIL